MALKVINVPLLILLYTKLLNQLLIWILSKQERIDHHLLVQIKIIWTVSKII